MKGMSHFDAPFNLVLNGKITRKIEIKILLGETNYSIRLISS